MNLQLEYRLARHGFDCRRRLRNFQSPAAEGACVIVNSRSGKLVTEAIASIRAELHSAKRETLALELSKVDFVAVCAES